MKKMIKKFVMLLFACSISAVLAIILDTGSAGFAAGLAAMAYINAIDK